MKTITVCRIENASHLGPYNDGDFLFCAAFPCNGVPNQPSPFADMTGPIPDDLDMNSLLFGFMSREDCLAWFPDDERDFLRHNGFVLAHYSAARILQGKHQVAFIPKRRLKEEAIP